MQKSSAPFLCLLISRNCDVTKSLIIFYFPALASARHIPEQILKRAYELRVVGLYIRGAANEMTAPLGPSNFAVMARAPPAGVNYYRHIPRPPQLVQKVREGGGDLPRVTAWADELLRPEKFNAVFHYGSPRR